MEQKINVAELLKDCPSGMELDCTICDNLYFNEVTPYMIRCYIKNDETYNSICFHHDGSYLTCGKAKCVIFPKGETTWEGFQRPFKDGDVVFYNDTIAIFKEWGDETLFRTYVTKYLCCDSLIDTNVPLFGKSVRKETRLATEEEKQKLFDAIKANGYKWNEETKTLEKIKKEYPKTYDECAKVLLDRASVRNDFGYKGELLVALQKLLVSRAAYWKIYGEQMGLGKPWEPDFTNDDEERYGIYTAANKVVKDFCGVGDVNTILTFPTEEMRDAFYVNFKKEIEMCKELL